jgi:hypothetical protein
MGMSREKAEAAAREGNAELGARGETRAFYIEVERAPGDWEIEKRTEPEPKKGFFRKALETFIASPGP